MNPNEYISRYSKYDTHFKREDPWKHVPWDYEVNKEKDRLDKIIFYASVLSFVLVSYVTAVSF